MSAYRQALRARPLRAAGSGDGGAEHPLGGGEVGHGARRGVGTVTSACCCRARCLDWLVGSAVLPAAPDDPAPSATEGAGSARGCSWPRASGRGRRHSGLAPTGASGGCCRPGWQNAPRSRLLQPQRKLAVLRLPDSFATAAWTGVGGECVASQGSVRGSHRSRPACKAAVRRLRCLWNSDRKMSPSGCSRIATAICRSSSLGLPVDEQLDHRDEREHQLNGGGGEFLLADTALRRASELGQQLGRGFCRPEYRWRARNAS